MTYVTGFLIPVPKDKRQAYKELATTAAQVFLEYGATRVVESWGDDIPDGKINDFRTSIVAEEGEEVVLSWIEWPSKEVRDIGSAKVMADDRMKPKDGEKIPFSGDRMIYGGFAVMVDERA